MATTSSFSVVCDYHIVELRFYFTLITCIFVFCILENIQFQRVKILSKENAIIVLIEIANWM